MSIALEEKVNALEQRLAAAERGDTALLAVDLLAQRVNALESAVNSFCAQLSDTAARCVELERTAQRKPGPKPKDAQ
jgi:hypothetical protein